MQNEAKEQKGEFLRMLLGTLGASLLGNMLADKGAIATSQRRRINRAGEGIIRTGCGSKGFSEKKILIPLTNLEIQKYYQSEPRFNGIYSRNNLPDKTKDGSYVVNVDKYSGIGTHWIALYALNNNVTYFDSFRVEHIRKEI